MQRQEHYHNTDEQVREYTVKALALVDALQPPDDLRAAVFAAAVGQYAAKSVVLEQPQLALPDLAGLGRG